MKQVTAAALGKDASDVVALRKLAEGGFNRTFEITMKGGMQVVARLPYSSTVPRRLAVASEVATLDLVRSYGLAVPRIFGYSTDPSNDVGAEYIIMEKLPGKQLGDTFYDMPEKQRLRLILEITKIEGVLFSIPLPASGSVYYSRDLPPDTATILIPDRDDVKGLCIGPHANHAWWYKERGNLLVERGPCELKDHFSKT